ncbi:MAG: hypothetical protein UZ14_CFX002001986 [Chloroflexi bacterium OLB14]|nr:MAG: hypothetical protein UZ14_CFX002001986 [Chloroflexi bacterium OLB14]
MKKLFSISFLFILIISCQSQATYTPTPITLTNTPESTSTPTQLPTLIPTATQITSIEFPDWVKNPETQILLVPVIEFEDNQFHYKGMYLFNAETSERFEVPFTEEVGDYFWMPDGSAFGFLLAKKKQVFLYSIKDEIITLIKVSDESLRFYERNDSGDFSSPIQVSSSNIKSPNFLFLNIWRYLSVDRKYFVYQEEYDGTYISIYDISKSDTIKLSDPNDDYFNFSYSWSPTQPLLAAIEVDEEQQGMFGSFQTLPIFRLQVYDAQSQKVVASYKNVTFPNWSPDGTKFLFQEWKGSEGFYWYGGAPPCIFDTLSGKTNCFNELIINDKINITSAYWSPDQSMISFVYMNYASDANPETGTFCTIQLATQNISCLLSKLDIENQNVIEYLWSPNSKFISFFYDTSHPISDYRDHPKLGIANIETGKYFYISLPSSDPNFLGLWRPSPNP